MINVYRIENDKGGPYRGNNVGTADYRPDDHPTPWSDGISSMLANSDYICGFASIKKLMAWFSSKDRDYLSKFNFAVVVYTSDDVVHGKKQVMFNKKTAIRQMVLELRKRGIMTVLDD